ncbi:MAG: rod shape-determining protein MreC [Spirochaetia bacterium]|jgi:rod shape-determining protein MreC|nr:rod shape-determining protein MreC [Spirochaetia bacterium]
MLGKKFIAKHKPGALLVLYVFVCFVCITFTSTTFVLKPRQLGLSFFSLFQGGISSIGSFIAETFDSVRVLGELRGEYEAALERLRRYEQIEKDILILKDENRRLSEVLSFSRAAAYENIPAKIIGKDPQNFHATIVVNRGSLSGVSKDMTVVGIQGGHQGLVGKVLSVGLNSALVQPLYDPNAFVAARLLSSRYEGLVNGSGEETIKMRYVKRYARSEIRFGDTVITSGLGTSLFPEGIEIGTVKTISARTYDTSLELDIEPIIDFSRLEYVYILKAGNDNSGALAPGGGL